MSVILISESLDSDRSELLQKMNEKISQPERIAHPFFMYDMIKTIPDSVCSTVDTVRKSKINVDSPEPLVFTGSGTAFYSALMGSQILNLTSVKWKAIQSFELANYENSSGGVIIGVSHSGITKSTLDALSKARLFGARVVGLSHFADRPIARVAEKTLLIGNGPDKSRCHTKTYAASSAATMELSFELTESLSNELEPVRKQFDSELLTKLSLVTKSTEETARNAVAKLGNLRKIFFVGAGPNLVTAREAALKIKESSYLPAEGMEMEEVLHGPWSAFDEDTLIVVVAPSGPSQHRAKDLLSASKELGATTILVSDSQGLDSDFKFTIPPIHEYLSPFLAIIPLYFFAYFLSVKNGNNPDYLHYLTPRYWDARQIIFPPGTH